MRREQVLACDILDIVKLVFRRDLGHGNDLDAWMPSFPRSGRTHSAQIFAAIRSGLQIAAHRGCNEEKPDVHCQGHAPAHCGR